jgi:hypothetical protein
MFDYFNFSWKHQETSGGSQNMLLFGIGCMHAVGNTVCWQQANSWQGLKEEQQRSGVEGTTHHSPMPPLRA